MTAPVHEGVRRAPPAVLRPCVEAYVGYRIAGFAPGTHQGLPSRHLTFIISLGDPVDIVGMPDPTRQRPGEFQAFVSGLHAGPAVIAHDGNQYGIALDLTPTGARALFGVPAAAVASVVVDLGEVLGRLGGELVERLALAPDWARRFEILDDALLRSLASRRPSTPAPEVGEAWRRVVASGGTVEVGALAGELGWSRRHLADRFRAEVGLPPKVAARVVRFGRSVAMLRALSPPPLAEVAARCGFYDQAHLNREWRELAGVSPARWLVEDFPSVQDAEAAPAAQ